MTSSCVEPSDESLRRAARSDSSNGALLALLLAADAAQLGRGIIGNRAIGLDGAVDCLGQRFQVVRERNRGFNKAGQSPHKACRRRLQQRLPRRDIVRESGNRLKLFGLQGNLWNARLGGKRGWIKQATKRNGNLFFEQQTKFGGETMLPVNPILVRGGPQSQ